MTLSLDDLKTEARRLRATLADLGQTLSHAQALETVARMRGYRDWNTLHAAVGNRPPGPPVSVGQSVGGAYLGRPFRAEVLAVAALGDGRFRVTVHFDEPVNVSAFESFEVLRRRVTASITREGESIERITGGAPQFKLTL
ncbi:MAG: glyoxalase superfamily protein [Paracoccaceae bacterium]